MGIVGLTYSSAQLARQVRRHGERDLAGRRHPDDRLHPDRAPPGPVRERTDERSPDNVAPIVAYLASERSGWITGRVIHSAGYEISLYNNPEPVIRIIGTGPWDDADALADQVERSFGPQLGRKG